MALRAASFGKKVLVLTVDPAQRLMTSLGLQPGSDQITKVETPSLKGEVYAGIVQSKKIFDDFISKYSGNKSVVDRIFKNRLYQQLSTTLSGSQEFTALEKLLQEYESKNFDLIILDTPPTKHALDFFVAPRRIINLFQDSNTKWFAAPELEPTGFISNLIYKGTKTVFKSLEILTGAEFIEELVDFFVAIRSVQKILRERSEKVEKLLANKTTSFVLITSFDSAKLEEANVLQKRFSKMKYQLDAVIINRAYPLWASNVIANPSLQNQEVYQKVLRYYNEFRSYYANRYKLYDDFAAGFERNVKIFRIPDYGQDICGIDDLLELSDRLASAQSERMK